MKPKRLLRISLWIATYFLLRTFGGMLVFYPGQGTVLEKQFNQEWEVGFDAVRLWVDGMEVSEFFLPGYYAKSFFSQEVLTRDTYGSIQGGQPLELQREFVRASQELEVFQGGSEKALWLSAWSHMTSNCELEGKTVIFSLGLDGYEPTFVPQGGTGNRKVDSELLAGLAEDMDLRVLLPTDSVSVGDTWEVNPTSFMDILSPGGYFPWRLESEEDALLLNELLDPVSMAGLRRALAKLMEGEVRVTYAAEEDGLARLDLDIDIRTRKDMEQLTLLVAEIVGAWPEWIEVQMGHLELSFDLEAKGVALWNMRRARLHSLKLDGKFDTRMELQLEFGRLGHPRPLPIEIRTVTSGSLEQRIEIH